jgi:beta-glucosidase/6-phospho-beta-glucosidase/beta-galactosidase
VWKGNEIDTAENGCGAPDDPGADSIVYDSDRIMFLRSFTQLQRASSEGIPAEPDGQVSSGQTASRNRFGLIYVGLRDAKAHADGERVVLLRGDRPKRGRVGRVCCPS